MKGLMHEDDYNLMISIAKTTQPQLQAELFKVLKRNYKNVINKKGDYLLAEGDIPVALVAHMDTVFHAPPEDIYFDRQAGVMWSPDGLGADDRAGVFLILKIIQKKRKTKKGKPYIIFTCNEEKGCIGASQLTMDYPECPWDLKYIIQLDRRGKKDCVFYENINREFIDYVETFGFIEEFGSFSDISMICPAWGIAGVNLSVGYEDEHMEIETLHIKPLYNTLRKVHMMLNEIEKAPKFDHIESAYSYSKWWRSAYPKAISYCQCCNKPITHIESIPALDSDGQVRHFCGECATTHVGWCKTCNEPFVKEYEWEDECPNCSWKNWRFIDDDGIRD